MRNLDEFGCIAEPCSSRYGEKPDSDTATESTLLRWSWAWLLMPILGFIPYTMCRDELTERWGHYPWWM